MAKMGRPRLTASEHWRLGNYRRDRHGPLPWEKPEPAPEPAAEDADSPWRHELRLPGPGESFEDVARKAEAYRQRSGVDIAEVVARLARDMR